MSSDFHLLATIDRFLVAQRTASLATVDDQGNPHAANIQYVHRPGDLAILWVSSSDSAHSRHIAARPDVALTIYAGEDNPATIHGLQLHATARRIESQNERDAAWLLYAEKFPFVQSDAMRARIEAQSFYLATPTWMRWIDNREGFGWKKEHTFDQ